MSAGTTGYSDLLTKASRDSKILRTLDPATREILIAYGIALGYRYDPSTGRLEPGGIPEIPEPQPEAPETIQKLIPLEYISAWRAEATERIADRKQLIRLIAKSKLLYRGRPNPDVLEAIRTGYRLVRIQVKGEDYFIVLEDGSPVAAVGSQGPVTEREALRILGNILEADRVLVAEPKPEALEELGLLR